MNNKMTLEEEIEILNKEFDSLPDDEKYLLMEELDNRDDLNLL